MQCVNCAFYNVPGSAACGRCGTTLRFDQLDVSVEPPRAGRGTLAARNRLLRLFHRGRAAAGRVREEVGSTVRPYLGERVPP
ncbi:MAG: hypothetical protein K2X87_15370, partial [Gemmataceae bacterium]|nr:hypothetical protein [Gemmataceae bacterium]